MPRRRIANGHGLPYIVMEYIDGPWITTYATQHKLGVEARLRLLLAVCSAVDYAHRNFIVHRDLKPGNILVDPAGVPKLLDFGICKLLVEAVAVANDTVGPPLTPRYASPEQIRGEPATTSSDIYSLGAVLYELLTDTGPRRFENLAPLAIERALESPIVRPSAAVGDKRLAHHYLDDLVKSGEHDARARKELVRAYRRLGDVQGNVESANLGDLPGALALYQKAVPLLDEAMGRESRDIEARTEQLIVYNPIARIQAETGNLRDALQTYHDAIARASIPAPSSHPEFRMALADAYLGSSHAKRDLGDDRGAFAEDRLSAAVSRRC